MSPDGKNNLHYVGHGKSEYSGHNLCRDMSLFVCMGVRVVGPNGKNILHCVGHGKSEHSGHNPLGHVKSNQ